MKKVKIIKFVGQTGLRKVGSVMDLPDSIAKSWIKRGYAKAVQEPKEPVKAKAKPKTTPKKKSKK